MNKNTVFWLIFFFPVGLWKLWSKENVSPKTKWAITAGICVLGIIGQFIPKTEQVASTSKMPDYVREASKEPASEKKAELPLGQYYTKGGQVACTQEQWLDDITKFAVAGDKGSFNAYIASNKCLVLKDDVIVTLDEGTMFGGTVTFFYEGVKFWTAREAIK